VLEPAAEKARIASGGDEMTEAQAEELARELLERLTNATPTHLGALFAPGGIVWHNHDRKDMDSQEDCDGIVGLREQVEGLSFQFVRSAGLPDGFLLRFIMSGTVRSNGRAMEGHNCLVAQVRDGRIVRIDEYVDPNLFSALGA
jgi:ketosteroid isomerase-like protein